MNSFSKHIEESNKLILEIHEFKGEYKGFKENTDSSIKRLERKLERRGGQ